MLNLLKLDGEIQRHLIKTKDGGGIGERTLAANYVTVKRSEKKIQGGDDVNDQPYKIGTVNPRLLTPEIGHACGLLHRSYWLHPLINS